MKLQKDLVKISYYYGLVYQNQVVWSNLKILDNSEFSLSTDVGPENYRLDCLDIYQANSDMEIYDSLYSSGSKRTHNRRDIATV